MSDPRARIGVTESEKEMKYKVFVTDTQGRTTVDEWANKTLTYLSLIYDEQHVKVDTYTNEGEFVTSVYLGPDGYGDVTITPAKGTVMVGESF